MMKIKGHPSSMRDGKPIRSSIPRSIYNEFGTDDADATDAIDSIYEKPLFDEEDLRDEDRSSVAEMDAEDSANYVSVEVIQDEQAAKRAKEWDQEVKDMKERGILADDADATDDRIPRLYGNGKASMTVRE